MPPLGQYQWTIIRNWGDYPTTTSASQTFRVAPAPLTRLTASMFLLSDPSFRTPGSARLEVAATPYSSIDIAFRRGRRIVLHRRYQQQPNSRTGNAIIRAVTYTPDCHQPGRYDYTAQAQDSAGHTLKRAGHWNAADCGTLARLRAAAERQGRIQARTERLGMLVATHYVASFPARNPHVTDAAVTGCSYDGGRSDTCSFYASSG